jgi:hypothetical protein
LFAVLIAIGNITSTPLDDYVAKTDGFYYQSVAQNESNPSYSVYIKKMISQKWMGQNWWHYVTVIIPKAPINFNDSATLYLASGTNSESYVSLILFYKIKITKKFKWFEKNPVVRRSEYSRFRRLRCNDRLDCGHCHANTKQSDYFSSILLFHLKKHKNQEFILNQKSLKKKGESVATTDESTIIAKSW